MSIFEPAFEPAEPTPRKRKNAKTDSIALIAQGSKDGVVLDYDGCIRFEIENVSNLTGDLGLDDAPEGLSIWEGKLTSHKWWSDCGYEYETELVGEFRDLTDEEWERLRIGACLWDYEPCVHCGDDGRIRCPDADCAICARDEYCERSEACSCGQPGQVWILNETRTVRSDEEMRELLSEWAEKMCRND